MTPEGKIKAKIREVLNKYGVYYYMPVVYGYGAAGLDMHCVVRAGETLSLAFFVEAKRSGKEPTERQKQFIKDRWEQQRAKTFVVDDDVTLQELEDWLDERAYSSIIKHRVPVSF